MTEEVPSVADLALKLLFAKNDEERDALCPEDTPLKLMVRIYLKHYPNITPREPPLYELCTTCAAKGKVTGQAVGNKAKKACASDDGHPWVALRVDLPHVFIAKSGAAGAKALPVRRYVFPQGSTFQYFPCEYNCNANKKKSGQKICPQSANCSFYHNSAEFAFWYMVDPIKHKRTDKPSMFDPTKNPDAHILNNVPESSSPSSSYVRFGSSPAWRNISDTSVESKGSTVGSDDSVPTLSQLGDIDQGELDDSFEDMGGTNDHFSAPIFSDRQLTKFKAIFEKYMFEYKVFPCPIKKDHDYGTCANVFHYHSEVDRRRDPLRTAVGGKRIPEPPWAYDPNDDCCSKSEVSYHPVNYKKMKCNSLYRKNCKLGERCSFLHLDEPTKQELFGDDFCSNLMTYEHFRFLVTTHKTKECQLLRSHSSKSCNGFHVEENDDGEKYSLDYREPWSVDSDGNYIVAPERTCVEDSWSPLRYKTELCTYHRQGQCLRRHCTYAHGEKEREVICQYKERYLAELAQASSPKKSQQQEKADTEPQQREPLPRLQPFPRPQNDFETPNLVRGGSIVIPPVSSSFRCSVSFNELVENAEDKYRLLREDVYVDVTDLLGHGMGQSRVFSGYMVKHKRDVQPVAVKILATEGFGISKNYILRNLQHEVGTLKQSIPSQSRQVVKLYDYADSFYPDRRLTTSALAWGDNASNGDYVYVIMEKFGNSLYDILHNLNVNKRASLNYKWYQRREDDALYPSEVLRSIAWQILVGLGHIHMGGMLHRDLRPTNILITSSSRTDDVQVKICDLGLARPCDPELSHPKYAPSSGIQRMHGTHPFQPLEVVVEIPPQYSRESDVYSAGLCIYFAATRGLHPFLLKTNKRSRAIEGSRNWFDFKEATEAEEKVNEELKNVRDLVLDNDPEDLEILASNYRLRGLDHAPELQDMLVRMLGGLRFEKKERPRVIECLAHPFFWTSEEKLDFIIHVSDALLRRDSLDRVMQKSCQDRLEKHKDAVFPMRCGQDGVSPQWDWRNQPDEGTWSKFVDRVQQSQLICSAGNSKYCFESFAEFLKMIRNVTAHMNYSREDVSFSREIREFTMENTKEGLAIFVLDRFPMLIVYLLKHCKCLECCEEAIESHLGKINRRVRADLEAYEE